ncbi:MAG: hypothetical protein OEX02_02470 [Cyclobacteriaceae bacterium]|nr:hypothetical protein [Cyclobacteriaceae bacterium]
MTEIKSILYSKDKKPNRVNQALVVAVFTCLIIAYLFNASYYYTDNPGVLGDNYLHMHKMMKEGLYVKLHHMSFPLLSDMLVNTFISTGIIQPTDPLFLEKCYKLSILPTGLLNVLALGLFFIFLLRANTPPLKAVLIFLTLSTSYTFWMWAIQNNSIGMALAWQVLISLYFYYWWQHHTLSHTVLFTLACCLSMFFHIGLVYFAIGTYLVMQGRILYLSKGKIKNCYKKLLLSNGMALTLGMAFIYVGMGLTETNTLSGLFDVLADKEYLKNLPPDNRNIFAKLIEQTQRGRFNQISYYYELFYPGWIVARIPTGADITQMTIQKIGHIALGVLGASILIYPKTTYKNGIKPFIFTGAVTSAISIVGFAIHPQSSHHYYAVAYVPYFLLFFGFIIPEREKRVEWGQQVLMIIIIALTVYYNVFSPLNIFRGKDLDYHPFYVQNSLINIHTKTKPAVFFNELDVGYYPNYSLDEYYRKKFGHIIWRSDTLLWNTQEKILSELENYTSSDTLNVYIGEKAKTLLTGDTIYTYIKIENNLWELQK